MRKNTPYFQEFILLKINTKMNKKPFLTLYRPRIKVFSQMSLMLLIPNLIKNFIKKYCVFLGIFRDGWTTDRPADQQTRKIIQSTPRVTPEILKAWTILFPSLYNTPKAFGWNTYSWVPNKAPHPSVDYKIFLKAKHAAMRHLSIFIKLHLEIDNRICIILIECGIN